jgi:hemin uptake protein HemP
MLLEANMPTILKAVYRKSAVPNRNVAPKQKSITTDELMGGAKELIILHAEEQYRLRITSNRKLILTK